MSSTIAPKTKSSIARSTPSARSGDSSSTRAPGGRAERAYRAARDERADAATGRLARGEVDRCEILHLESLAHELGDATVVGADGWLLAVRQQIRACGAHPPSLAELAEEAGRHPAHVARAFRARWGMTPGEYGRRLRVARAVGLLQGTARSTATVALDSGFADQSHMGRWMARYLGLTPAQVRGRSPGERRA